MVAKEYIWLPGAGYAGTDLPVGVVDVAGTATPELLYVHADHLGRPIRLTDGAKVTAWAVEWLPWGGVHAISGSETLNARFPGQWFQVESGLHYNWHRHYDPTIGRYTQPDPLGFVDGPSVYAYARNAPGEVVDPDGRIGVWVPYYVVVAYCRANPAACAAAAATTAEAIKNICLMAAEHTKGKRPSTKEKHEGGEARQKQDQGGEKADERRDWPSKRPPWHKKGPWPPKSQ